MMKNICEEICEVFAWDPRKDNRLKKSLNLSISNLFDFIQTQFFEPHALLTVLRTMSCISKLNLLNYYFRDEINDA